MLRCIVMVQGRLHCIVLGGGLVQGRLEGRGKFDASNRVTRFKESEISDQTSFNPSKYSCLATI